MSLPNFVQQIVIQIVLLATPTVGFYQMWPFQYCDYFQRLSANEGVSIVNPGGYISIWGIFGYLGFFDPGSSCRYSVQGPPNYVIQLKCTLNMAITVGCEAHLIGVCTDELQLMSVVVDDHVVDVDFRVMNIHVRRNDFEFWTMAPIRSWTMEDIIVASARCHTDLSRISFHSVWFVSTGNSFTF